MDFSAFAFAPALLAGVPTPHFQMTPEVLSTIKRFLILLPPFLFTITCHEVAHGLVAYRLGDPTAYMAGRLTLNPLRHLDPVGVLVFILTSVAGAGIGWAKPVPVNPGYFKNPRRGSMLVSLAGPLTNLVLAVLFALTYHGLTRLARDLPDSVVLTVMVPLLSMAHAGIIVSLVLGLFNLIPVPPLDGGGIVAGLLPLRLAYSYEQIGRYGFFIVLLLVMTGFVQKIIGPILVWLIVLLRIPLF